MKSVAEKLDNYNYADYESWDDGKRYEILEGFLYNMSPAPAISHQQVVIKLSSIFEVQLYGKKCTPFVSPVDVLLDYTDNSYSCETIVQPDVLVVCDKKKINERGIFGAPDLAVEVVSPSSIDYDMNIKKQIYQKYGIPEYWVVFPLEKTVVVYNLEDGEYKGTNYIKEGVIKSAAIKNLTVDLAKVFEGR